MYGDDAKCIIRILGFRHSIINEARGFSGGIWVLWNNDDLHLQTLMIQGQFVHIEVDKGQ